MVIKNYTWKEGATLDDHTKRKHKILREYFVQYLVTRCSLPQQEKFRLAVVDGFSGAGVYKCGNSGSPLIFIETLKKSIEEINLHRTSQGMRSIEIECFLIFNDFDQFAIEQLRRNVAPYSAEIKDTNKKLHIHIEYNNKNFEDIYPEIKNKIQSAHYRNVIFNLDQCGHSKVNPDIIKNIMTTWTSAEVFLTFQIKALLAYLSSDKSKNRVLLKNPELLGEIFGLLENNGILINKKTWLGKAEQLVFSFLKGCAPYVSPFSINNPAGWGYWLMHFANSFRARQVYNNVLHENSTLQAHFGRPGLNMLSYDPEYEGALYLFNDNSREAAKQSLHDDIPRLITSFGDALPVQEFYSAAYNETAAHSDDIHEMIIENPDVEVITPVGGERRKPDAIKSTDILKLKRQKSMFPIFFNKDT